MANQPMPTLEGAFGEWLASYSQRGQSLIVQSKIGPSTNMPVTSNPTGLGEDKAIIGFVRVVEPCTVLSGPRLIRFSGM